MSDSDSWRQAGPVYCSHCGRTFVKASGLFSHLLRKHYGLGTRARSLEMERARRALGWPQNSDFRPPYRKGVGA